MRIALYIYVFLFMFLFQTPHLLAYKDICNEFPLIPETTRYWDKNLVRVTKMFRFEVRTNKTPVASNTWIYIKFMLDKNDTYTPYMWEYDYQGIVCEGYPKGQKGD